MPKHKRTIIVALAVVMVLGFASPALAYWEKWSAPFPDEPTVLIYDNEIYISSGGEGFVMFQEGFPGNDYITDYYNKTIFTKEGVDPSDPNIEPADQIILIASPEIDGTEITGEKETYCSKPFPRCKYEGGYGFGTPGSGTWRALDAYRNVIFYGRWTSVPGSENYAFQYCNALPFRFDGKWSLDGSDDLKAKPIPSIDCLSLLIDTDVEPDDRCPDN